MTHVEPLTCCVCGGDAGKYAQHGNRDHGYGICPACVAEEKVRLSPEELASYYGTEDVNFSKPWVRLNGLRYGVLGATKSQDAANAFIARTPGASVLMVFDDGLIVIADAADLGTPVPASAG